MPEGVLVGSSNWSMLKVVQEIFFQLLRRTDAMIRKEFWKAVPLSSVESDLYIAITSSQTERQGAHRRLKRIVSISTLVIAEEKKKKEE